MKSKAVKRKRTSKKKPVVHLGHDLAAHIKENGLKKVTIAGKFGVSRQWFNTLLATGNFNTEQKKLVKTLLKKSDAIKPFKP